MVDFYVMQIRLTELGLGTTTLNDVPERFRKQVEKKLAEI